MFAATVWQTSLNKMEDKTKRIIKKVLFWVLVPTAFVISYYGIKYGIKKYSDYKKTKEDLTKKDEQ